MDCPCNTLAVWGVWTRARGCPDSDDVLRLTRHDSDNELPLDLLNYLLSPTAQPDGCATDDQHATCWEQADLPA
jgi:hypothetical protein